MPDIQNIELPAGTVLRMTREPDSEHAALALVANGNELVIHRGARGIELHGTPDAFETFFGRAAVAPDRVEAEITRILAARRKRATRGVL